jgi:hypothetical protein
MGQGDGIRKWDKEEQNGERGGTKGVGRRGTGRTARITTLSLMT